MGGWDVNVDVDVLTCHLLRYWSLLVSAQLRHVPEEISSTVHVAKDAGTM